MKLAALQMKAKAGDVEANLARIATAARDAAAQGADLLAAPELAVTGYGAGAAFPALALSTASVSDRLGAIARETGIAVITGFAETDDGVTYNSALFIDGTGQSVAYRKSHLYGPYERQWFRPAVPSSVLVTHRGIRLGLLICYDVEFPENVRRLAIAGADLIVVPTALPEGPSGAFIAERMIQVRAFENQVFVAYVNHCGADENFSYAGLSRIAAPDGTLLADAPADGEALLLATIDPGDFTRSRSENTYLEDLARQV